jgi:hypothetical protein
MKQNAGIGFPMEENVEILGIDSPRKNVVGPWLVVHKDLSERWAIVVLHWQSVPDKDPEPCLGIRWFYGNQGTPSVRTYATWLIIPKELTDNVLDKLPLPPQHRHKVNEILLGKYTLDELKQIRKSDYGI